MSTQPIKDSTCEPNQQKLTKACATCHARKVKCDAPTRGLPCTRCLDRGESCVLKGRQRRRFRSHPSPAVEARSGPLSPTRTSEPRESLQESRPPAVTGSPNTVVASDTGPWKPIDYNNGIHYLSILTQAVRQDASKTKDLNSGCPEDESIDPKVGIQDLDPDDLEYLIKKGVFDLPPQSHLETLLKAYFEFVYPFAPVLDRTQFLKDYRRGCYSIFLIQAVLTSAMAHAPEHVIFDCGYTSRATAQQSFFSKAALLCDFFCEKSQLPLLQGCLILGTAMVPRSKDKDIRYWFYNSVRLAVGMELHKSHASLGIDSRKSKLFKRIWWVVYSRDIVLSLFGTQNIRLLGDREYDVGLFTADEWESEQLSEHDLSILPIISPQQKIYFVEYCKLAIIGSQCLSAVKDHRDDPQTLTSQISAWRLALPDLLVHDLQHPENLWSTMLLAISYRFECILLRLLRVWWRRRNASWYEWTKRKLQLALFELDTITGRAWSNRTLLTLPLSFKSCIHTALAIHIEILLDDSESEINRSMSRISIERSMLLLGQLKDDPVLQLAIPIFERVLIQTNMMPASSITQTQPPLSDPPVGQDSQLSPSQPCSNSQLDSGPNGPILQDSLGEYSLWFKDFLGFDFLDT